MSKVRIFVFTFLLINSIFINLMFKCLNKFEREVNACLKDQLQSLQAQKAKFDDFYNKSFARMYVSLADGYRHLRRHERWLNYVSGYPSEQFPWKRGNLPLETETNGIDPARNFDGANMYGFPVYKKEAIDAQKHGDDGRTPLSWFTTSGK